jgi:hypothetical protein
MRSKPIYVEIVIRAPMEALWAATQDPAKHQRWDLRFTDIDYLDRENPSAAQTFLYTTRMGGMHISGEGETTTTQNQADGSRVSALLFSSADPKSLIDKGSGYWKYTPVDRGIRFVTWYDYTVRFGLAGRIADGLVFRRLLGWATAWSFDRLRLWLEDGIVPEASLRAAIAHHAGRFGVGLGWLYQGVIPKLLDADSGEVEIVMATGMTRRRAKSFVAAAGVAETAIGLACLAKPRSRWALVATLIALPLLGIAAARSQPRLFSLPFSPGSLSLTMGVLSVVALAVRPHSPSASRCLRKPSPEQ